MTAKSKRRLGTLAALIAAAILVFGVAAYVRHQRDARRLAEQVASLDAADPHWRLDDLVASLRTTSLPDDENLHGKLLEASAAAANQPSRTAERNALFRTLVPNVRLAPAEWRLVIVGVEANEDAIAPALQFERYPRGRHEDAYPGDGYATAYRTQDKVATLRNRFLKDFFLAAVQRRDRATAVTLIRGSLNIGRSFRDEPLRPSQAWRARMRKDAVRGLERLLGHVELPDATLAELGREFAAELDDDLLLLAARGTLAQADRVAEMARRGEMPASQFRSACEGADAPSPVKSVRDWVIDRIGIDTAGYHADALANARLVLDAARRPWPEHWQAIQALDPPTHWQRTRLGRSTLLGVQTFALDVARLRCAMVAIAVERHRLAHGDWPASLTTLGPLAGDPFTGGPLHYRRTAEGVEVFVASPPFDDQGDGWIDPAVGGLPLNQGIGFCLYDVPHRNQVGGR